MLFGSTPYLAISWTSWEDGLNTCVCSDSTFPENARYLPTPRFYLSSDSSTVRVCRASYTYPNVRWVLRKVSCEINSSASTRPTLTLSRAQVIGDGGIKPYLEEIMDSLGKGMLLVISLLLDTPNDTFVATCKKLIDSIKSFQSLCVQAELGAIGGTFLSNHLQMS